MQKFILKYLFNAGNWCIYLLSETDNPRVQLRRLFLVFIIAIFFIPLIGFGIVKIQTPQLEEEAYSNLQAIAELKANQIELWLNERRGDAKVISADRGFVEQVVKLQNGDISQWNNIHSQLEGVLYAYEYEAVLLVNTRGQTLMAIGEHNEIFAPTRALVLKAFESAQPQMGELLLEETGKSYMDYVAPLLVTINGKSNPVGAVVLHINPNQFLFPYIQRWPTASKSGETLLFRKDGDNIIFMNELRHKDGTALKLKFSVNEPNLPAAIAVRSAMAGNKSGTVAGKDYRKVTVLAAYRSVSATNWFVIAKIDRAEVLAPLTTLIFWISLIAVIAIAMVCVMVLMLLRQQRRTHQLELQSRSFGLIEESEQRFRAMAQSSSGAIISADIHGRIVNWNPSATQLFGYAVEEIVGESITRLMPQRFQDAHSMGLARVASGGSPHVIGKVIELAGLRKNGEEFPLELSLSQWTTGSGQFFTAMIRDITERTRAVQILNESEQRFRNLVEQPLAGVGIIQDGKFVYVNPHCVKILGYDSVEELMDVELISLITEKDRQMVIENMRLRIGSEESIRYEFTAIRKDNTLIHLDVHGTRASYEGRPALFGIVQDISERKRADETIQRYVSQLENVFIHTVNIINTLSEVRDPYTAGHERRVADIAVAIGIELGLDDHRIEGLRIAGCLHDLGKITIPAELLSKPRRFSEVEYSLVKEHSKTGYDILKDVEFPWPVADIVLQHHERIDGSGYPQGLKGEAILYEARIMAVADVVEAMSSHRPYRPALGIEKALAEIEDGSGTIYDENVVGACLQIFRKKGFVLSEFWQK
jgi:PAS domain S-box-containing protein